MLAHALLVVRRTNRLVGSHFIVLEFERSVDMMFVRRRFFSVFTYLSRSPATLMLHALIHEGQPGSYGLRPQISCSRPRDFFALCCLIYSPIVQ